MKSGLANIGVLAAVAAGTVFSFQNCGGFNTAIDSKAKASLVENRVFATGDQQPLVIDGRCYQVDVVGTKKEIPCPDSSPTPTPTPNPSATPTPIPSATPTPTPPVVVVPPAKLPVDLFCSVNAVLGVGGTLRAAESSNVIYSFADQNNAVVCEVSQIGGREAVINTSHITIEGLAQKCPSLNTGRYFMTMKTVGWTGKSFLISYDMSARATAPTAPFGTPEYFQQVQTMFTTGIIYSLKVKVTKAMSGQIDLVADEKAPCEGVNAAAYPNCLADFGTNPAKIVLDTNPGPAKENLPERCEHSTPTSPLVIQLGNEMPIRLTPPLDGIRFDIMGQNAVPAHTPKLISWFDDTSAAANYLLALPDENGEIRGIDELFGDNTTGPDGRTASNGYTALAKYDGRLAHGGFDQRAVDGLITPDDEVFDDLRLWADANRDGIAQASEVSTLASRGISVIDLNYDPNYLERDQFGNEIRMKSVVKTRDGKLHRIYDIWFRTFK